MLDIQSLLPVDIDAKPNAEHTERQKNYIQNVHPLLAMYEFDLSDFERGFAKFSELVSMDNKMQLLKFFADIGLLAKYHQCEFCGGQIRKSKQGNIWY